MMVRPGAVPGRCGAARALAALLVSQAVPRWSLAAPAARALARPAGAGTCGLGPRLDWKLALALDAAACASGASSGDGASASHLLQLAVLASKTAAPPATVAPAVPVFRSTKDPSLRNWTASSTLPPAEEELERELEQKPFHRVPWKNETIVMRLMNQTELDWIEHAVWNNSRGQLVVPRPAEEVHSLAKNAILPSTAVFMLSMLVGSVISNGTYTKFVPETLCTVLVALILGYFVRRMLLLGFLNTDSFELIDTSILNLVLLPIIIFNGGWSMNLPHFSSQFMYCLIFAIGGTVITMFFMGYSSWLLVGWLGLGKVFGLRENMAFAALISATDPVATLATYAELDIAKRQPLLNTLVIGESMINDAVAIVFFNALNTLHKTGWHGMHAGIFERTMILFGGSMVLGVLVSSALIWFMRLAKLPGQTTFEILYMFLAPFFIFALADALDFSGIIAVLFAGIMFKTYGAKHLTTRGRKAANAFFDVVSKLADSGVFILCGTSTALINSLEGLQYGVMATLLCLLGRAIATVICTGLCNGLKTCWSQQPLLIDAKNAFMIWLGGLRGGIALVLALELDTTWCGEEVKTILVNSTFIVICSLLLLCGGTTELFLVALGMVNPETLDPTAADGLSSTLPLGSDDESMDERLKRENATDQLPKRIGDWLHGWFMYMLVGESIQVKRRLSSDNILA